MKNNWLCFFAAAFLILPAAAQIPNGGFENWTNAGAYENPDQWGTMNNTTDSSGVFTAVKGTPGNPGSFYLKLVSKMVGPSVVPGIAVSGALDSTTMTPLSGFAFNQRPASFTGSWQHMDYGTSYGSVSILLTRWNTAGNTRDTVAFASSTLSTMVMSWTNFSIHLNYFTTSNPDTCIIVLRASGNAPTVNDYLYVDNLAFTGTAGIQNENPLLSQFSVYPNPANDQLNVVLDFKSPQHALAEITDVSGRVVLSQDAGVLNGNVMQTLDVSALAKGIYMLCIVTGSGTETQRIVIE